MATTPVGTVYPKARGTQIKVLNDVVYDIIEAYVQCYLCDAKEEFPKDEHEQHGYTWKKIGHYITKVINYHKY